MDWFQFIASVVGSLAWPSVLIVLLIILRRQIGSLATRLDELTLPGGAKAKFVRELDAVRKVSEKIPIATRFSRGNLVAQDGVFVSRDDLSMLRLRDLSPEVIVLEAYKKIEETIEERSPNLPVELQRRNPVQLIEELAKKGFLDSEAHALFFRLRETRNTAAHAGSFTKITSGEAIEFREHAKFLAEILQKAIDDFVIAAGERKNAP